ncbi:MAG: tocopherol cyclase family protein [Lachnospiraceae bacterium]
MKNKFEGYYFKLQKEERTLAIIPGCAKEGAFIQVITNERSYNIPYDHEAYYRDGIIQVGKSHFWKKGMVLDIESEEITLKGRLKFNNLITPKKDIMGPLRHFPMECRHVIVSLRHDIEGTVELNGENIDFSFGVGYTEGDRGRSFPEAYSWVQCNVWEDWKSDCAVMAAAAVIPFAGMKFWGCIAVVWHEGKEYRFATYKGARVRRRTSNELILLQGKMRLTIIIATGKRHRLYAPVEGNMQRMIHEGAAVSARVIFEIDNQVVMDRWSNHAGYEYV